MIEKVELIVYTPNIKKIYTLRSVDVAHLIPPIDLCGTELIPQPLTYPKLRIEGEIEKTEIIKRNKNVPKQITNK